MSTFSVSTALAHGVLSSSSAWAIWETKDYVFAPIGFLLYFINGVLGLIAYGVADCVRVHKLHKAILLSGLSLSLPLFSSQLYVEQFITSPGHRTIAASTMMPLVVHMAPLLAQVTFLRHLSPSPLHAIYLASLVYISLYKGYYYGVTTAASLLIALYLIGPSGMVFSVPSRVLFNYALSFSVYFLVQTFHGNSDWTLMEIVAFCHKYFQGGLLKRNVGQAQT